jgi:hypothetical protein
MKRTLESFLSFLIKPYKNEEYDTIQTKVFIFLLLITLGVVLPYALILDWAGIDQFDHKMMELLENNKWLIAVLAIFIAPLLEEPIYRLHLDLKKTSISWSLGLSVLVISDIWYPVVLLWGYLIFLLIRVNKNQPPNLKFVVYSSAALFALVHMANFNDFDYRNYFYLVPFLVGAQFVVGLVLSFIRLNHGMVWAIIFHAVYNAVLIIPSIYFYEP